MEPYLIELLEPIVLTKENCPTITYEKGTILKVIMEAPAVLIASSDSYFNFTIKVADKDTIWKIFKE